jgi:ParB-like chromosome segregation protein Spo0J
MPDPLRIERVPIDSINPDPANVRAHPERNLEAIKGSLARFGQQKPIVVDGDGIVRAGNGTLAAARSLGWTEIDVVRTKLRGADAVAYAIADNRTGDLAEWDPQALHDQVVALPDDLREVIAFEDDEIAALIDEAERRGMEDIEGLEQGIQLAPEREYMVITFDTPAQWEEAQRLLGLKTVVRLGGDPETSVVYRDTATERVVAWPRARDAMKAGE